MILKDSLQEFLEACNVLLFVGSSYEVENVLRWSISVSKQRFFKYFFSKFEKQHKTFSPKNLFLCHALPVNYHFSPFFTTWHINFLKKND